MYEITLETITEGRPWVEAWGGYPHGCEQPYQAIAAVAVREFTESGEMGKKLLAGCGSIDGRDVSTVAWNTMEDWRAAHPSTPASIPQRRREVMFAAYQACMDYLVGLPVGGVKEPSNFI